MAVMYMLIILTFADNMILLNLSLEIFAAPVEEEEKELRNLEMMLVMMMLRIMMMK